MKLIDHALRSLIEMRNYSDFRASKVLSSLIKDLNYIQAKKLTPVAVVMDSRSLGFFMEKDKHRMTQKSTRFYWRQLPVYVDHAASFRADVIGEPSSNISQDEELMYNTVRSLIRQGLSKEDIDSIIDDCFLDDLFA